ncbi:MAG: MBL fold metallo-hydrolase [bacterium]|nr:MBL fold metallo-hydrolase [bacterium]
MTTTDLGRGAVLYTFPPDAGDFATCIAALVHGDRALLIDSGYERHATRMIEYLGARVTVDTVVLSHEHEDHSHGCRVLPECRIVAAPNFPGHVLPGRRIDAVDTGDRLVFGPFRLEFFVTPGHSHHHLVTRVDRDWAHAGDLIIHTADRCPTPPYLADGGSLTAHLESLAALAGLKARQVVCGHGPVLAGTAVIDDAIARRTEYLHRLEAAKTAIPLATGPDARTRHDFHRMNLEKLGLAEA